MITTGPGAGVANGRATVIPAFDAVMAKMMPFLQRGPELV
jgi:hypothetical protein